MNSALKKKGWFKSATTRLSTRSSIKNPSNLANTHTLFFLSIAHSSSNEHDTTSIGSCTVILAGINTQVLYTEQQALFSPTNSSRSEVINTLFNSPVLAGAPRKAVSAISSTRKHTARNTLFQALIYGQLPSCYSFLTPHDLKKKRQELQAAKNFSASPQTAMTIKVGGTALLFQASLLLRAMLPMCISQVVAKLVRLSPAHSVLRFLKKTRFCFGTILLLSPGTKLLLALTQFQTVPLSK